MAKDIADILTQQRAMQRTTDAAHALDDPLRVDHIYKTAHRAGAAMVGKGSKHSYWRLRPVDEPDSKKTELDHPWFQIEIMTDHEGDSLVTLQARDAVEVVRVLTIGFANGVMNRVSEYDPASLPSGVPQTHELTEDSRLNVTFLANGQEDTLVIVNPGLANDEDEPCT